MRRKIKSGKQLEKNSKLMLSDINFLIGRKIKVKLAEMLINLVLIMILPAIGYTQKPTISVDTYKTWGKIRNGKLSYDGNYACYEISNYTTGKNLFIIKSILNSTEFRLENISDAIFSSDSKTLYGKSQNDTLIIIDLLSKNIERIPGIETFKLFESNNQERLAYLTLSNEFYIKGQREQKSNKYTNVVAYMISENGSKILLGKTNANSDIIETLEILYTDTKDLRTIYSGNNITNLTFKKNSDQIAFTDENEGITSIWRYSDQLKKSERITEIERKNGQSDLYDLKFSKDGNHLFYCKTEKKNSFDSIRKSSLDIWNYKDSYLKSQYYTDYGRISYSKEYTYSIELRTGITKQLTENNELISLNTFNFDTDQFLIIEDSYGNLDETSIETSKIKYSICDTKTGLKKIFIPERNTPVYNIQISPTLKYVVYYDPSERGYISYNILTQIKVNISQNISKTLVRYDMEDEVTPEIFPAGIIGWTRNDQSIIINGSYDIWALDPTGHKKPENLTRGIGESGKIVFNAVDRHKKVINTNQTIILTSFNTINKEFGFYMLNIGKRPLFKKLQTGNYCISNPMATYAPLSSDDFIAVPSTNKFLILMQSVDSYPNYYYSNDLIRFKAISNYQPQRSYNWMTSELHNYTDKEGRKYSGILYKPENFDSSKKYPILFNYYEKQSNTLNLFLKVNPEVANFSIPIAVSNGYLVFLPDINSSIGLAGEGALCSIIAAVEHLSKYSWANISKMGIAGHSFGGFETNYIISQTTMFQAAVSGAGNSEVISMAYDIWGDGGMSKQAYYQLSAPKMGDALADNPDIYIKNSPLIFSRKISTPLLLVHNDADVAVPFRQSRQLFIALRSQHKPVWLLNYKGEGHLIGKEINQVDYSGKVFDFFDCYLKGKQEPRWMLDHN